MVGAPGLAFALCSRMNRLMSEKLRAWVAGRKFTLLCSIALAALSLFLAVRWWMHETPSTLQMSAGPAGTRRHAVAEYLCNQAAKHDLTIDLATNAGAEDCLNQIKSGELDAAIVSNGLTVPNDDDIVVLGALQLEALHVLVRKEMAGAPLFETIRGKRLNIGEQGSTERLLALELLEFGRLRLPSDDNAGDVIVTEHTKGALFAKSQAILAASGDDKQALIDELPDCLVVLATLPSTLVQSLVEAAEYQLVPVPATRAFLLDNLQNSEGSTTVVQREFLEPTAIPAHSYYSTHAFPATDCETVGVRLLVIARADVPAKDIRPLMLTLFEGELLHRLHTQSPRAVASPYAMHAGAQAYLDRDKPLVINRVMEWASQGFSALGAFGAGALSLYGLLRHRKARKIDYFGEIRKVEQITVAATLEAQGSQPSLELIHHLDERLLKLRQELIEDICEGRINGEQRISNILALLKDARRHLTQQREAAEPAIRVRPPRFGSPTVYSSGSSTSGKAQAM